MRSLRPSRERLEKAEKPRLVDTPKGKMLIPKPVDVDRLLHKVEKGKLVTVTQIMDKLAKDFCAAYTCPLTPEIFLWVSAETAEEDLKIGRRQVAPYWRVINDDGSLNEKFMGGVEIQASRLAEEGHTILLAQGKKPPKVRNFESSLQTL